MKRSFAVLFVVASLCAFALTLAAHPHFNKSVVVKLPSGVEVTITYNTTPANEANATKAAVGAFVTPRRPMIKLSGEIKAGEVVVPAGEYILGVIKNSDTDWTMALYAGQIARGQQPDMSKVIKLESIYSAAAGTAPHMLIDISPGSGKFEGRAVLTLHFGSLFLAGAVS